VIGLHLRDDAAHFILFVHAHTDRRINGREDFFIYNYKDPLLFLDIESDHLIFFVHCLIPFFLSILCIYFGCYPNARWSSCQFILVKSGEKVPTVENYATQS